MRTFQPACLALALFSATAAWPQAPGTVEKNNMELVGYSDLQARSAYQPLVHKQGERWIAYVGHHGGKSINPLTGNAEDNGTSIIDVTDPRQPKMLAHIPGEPLPSLASVLALEALAVARELPLELLASLLRHTQAPRLVLVERKCGVDACDIVPPKCVGELLGAKAIDAEPFQDGPSDLQRRFESLALHHGHAAQAQLEVVAHVARAAHDLEAGEIGAHALHQRDARVHVVDGVHQQPRLARSGGLEEVQARRVAVKDLVAELAQRIDLVRVVVEHHRANVVGEQ